MEYKAFKIRELRNLRTLSAFANLNSMNEWKTFFRKHPSFVAFDLCYDDGFGRWLRASVERTSKTEAEDDSREERADQSEQPYLLFLNSIRDQLRNVWASNDPDGRSLSVLYGFERLVFQVSSQSVGDTSQADRNAKLPPGKPVVDGRRGRIIWNFSTEFQESVYELLEARWRAKVCPCCAKYFLAVKNAQTFCSESCAHSAKVKRAIDYWNREGRAKRNARTKGKGK